VYKKKGVKDEIYATIDWRRKYNKEKCPGEIKTCFLAFSLPFSFSLFPFLIKRLL